MCSPILESPPARNAISWNICFGGVTGAAPQHPTPAMITSVESHPSASFDNDISAHDGSHRPGYQALITAVSAPNPTGAQRRIIVRHTDRLWRNRVERAHGIELLGKLGVRILPVRGPELDLTSASGRMLAG